MRAAEELAQLGSFEIDLRDVGPSGSRASSPASSAATPRYRHRRTRSSSTLIDPADRARARALTDQAIRARGEFGYQIRVMRVDRSLRTIQVQGRVLVDTDGRATRIAGCVQDVTDRVRAEEWSKRFFDLVESSEDAIIGLTLAGTIESWNAAAAKLFGLSAKAAIGMPCYDPRS